MSKLGYLNTPAKKYNSAMNWKICEIHLILLTNKLP